MWIYNLFLKRNKLPKAILAFLLFVLPVVLLFLPYVFMRIEHLAQYNIETWIGLGLAGTWAFSSPLLINGFFEELALFKQNVTSLISNSNDVIQDDIKKCTADVLESIICKEQAYSSKRVWRIFAFWGSLITVVLLLFNRRLADFAFYGFKDVYYWIALLYIVFLLYLQSIGFSSIILSYKIINQVLQQHYVLEDILEGSFEEGIESLGRFLQKTALYFFTGIMFFPILIAFAKNQSIWLWLAVVVMMMIFIVAVLVFFLRSYYLIWKSASERKCALITKFRNIYTSNLRESFKNNDRLGCSILNELKTLNISNHLKRLEQINVYPIHISNTLVTIFTIIFPALFFVKDLIELFSYILSL